MLRLFLISFYIIYLFTFTFFNLIVAGINVEHRDSIKLVLKVKDLGVNTIFRHLKFYNLTQYDQLTPFTYILDYKGPRRSSALQQTITQVKRLYKKKILVLEHVREYNDTIKPVDTFVTKFSYQRDVPDLRDTNLICDNYYGMGIEDAWSRGYTGKGVTIAITDVGVNSELLDLKQNINTNLSFNFVDNNSNVNPEYYYNIRAKAAHYTDHGNKMASIIGATKGNNLCSAGIAHNATIVALKIFRVTKTKSDFLGLHPRHWTVSDIFARALKYKLHTIDVFANAWAPVNPFDKLDIATIDVLSYGASNGRRGLGTIYVVPSGPPGSQLSNNINTITVNSMGRYGTILGYTYTDASVLTSGLGEGNNLTSTSMVTTTLKNRCITSFGGVSAVTAQIAAIIALGLQANKMLSLRDVQHILIHSSEHKQLRENKSFIKNAAGRHFHKIFGFGLINADTFVENTLKHRHVSTLLNESLELTRTPQKGTQMFEFCYECRISDRSKCLTILEHVVLQLDLKGTSRADLKIALISPGRTTSVLIDGFKYKQDKPVAEKKLQLLSVHFWDEKAFGKWQLLVTQGKHSESSIRLANLSLKLYGTASTSTSEAYQQYSNVCSSNERRNTKTTGGKLRTTKSPKSGNVNYYEEDTLRYIPLIVNVLIMFLLLLSGIFYH